MDVDVNMPGYGVDTASKFNLGTMQGGQAVAAGEIQAVFSTGTTRRQSDRKRLSKFGMSPKKDEIAIYHTGPEIPNHTLLDTPPNTEGNLNNLKGVGTYFTQRRAVSSTYAATGSNAGISGAEQSQLTQYAAIIKKRDFLDLDAKISGKKQLSLARRIHEQAEEYYASVYGTRANIPFSKIMQDVVTMDDLRLSIFNSYKSPKFNSTENSYPVNRSTEAQDSEYHSQMAWVQGVKAIDKKGVLHVGGNIMGDGKKHQVAIAYDSVPIREVLSKEEKGKVAELITPNTQLTYESSQSRNQEIRNLEYRLASLKNDYSVKRKNDKHESESHFQPTSSLLNAGGTIPGVGNTDKVPAMLTPGEFVINKEATQSNLSLLHAINDGNTPQSMQGFNKGGQIPGMQYFTNGGLPQSGYYGAPPQIKKQTRDMPEWSTQNAEMLAARQAAEALGATTEQIENNINRVAAHLIEGQGDIKYWVANNLMTDLQAINQYMNRVPKVAQTILNDTQMIDDVARRTGLSSSKVAEELDLLVKRVHPSTIEAASVLKHLSELDAQASLAVQQARQSGARVSKKTSFGTNSDTGYLAAMTTAALEERMQGDFYDTRGDRAYSTPEGGYQTSRGGTAPLPTPVVEEFKGVPADLSNKERKELRAQVQEEVKNSPVSQYASAADRKKLEDQIYERRLIEENHKKRSRLIDEEVSFLEEKGVSRKKALKIAEKTVDDDRAGIAKQKAEERFDRKYSVVPRKTQTLPIVPPNLDPEMDMESSSVEGRSRRGGIKQKIGSGLMKSGGAIGMLSMLPFMMQNEEGNFLGMNANMLGTGMMVGGMAMPAMGSAIGAMGGGGALAAMAPILGPIALGAAAVGVGLMIWRKSVDNAARETAKLGANMGGTANALNNMATLLGTSTPTQRKAQMQLGFTAEQQQQAASQFQPIFESEAGQKFVKDLESATSADRFTKLSDYLKTAIASGMMDTQSANLFAKTIASVLSDPVLGQSIIKSISGQKSGAGAMLGLAQNRESAVVAGGQLSVLGANQTVEEGAASSVIGSSIQLIQDFSNASALAKEELVAGTISYSKYKEIIDQSTAAQEKYTQAIETSFMKTEDFGATMQAWKDQLTFAGFSEDVINKIEQATNEPQSRGSRFSSLTTSSNEKLGISTNMLKSSATQAILSGMNPGQVEVISKAISEDAGGVIAQTFARTKDIGLTGLQYNIQQGTIPEFAVSDQLRSKAKGGRPQAGIAQQEIQRREQGGQAYVSAGEKFKGAGFAPIDFQQVMSMVNSPNVVDLSSQLSGMSDTEIKDTVVQTQKLNELIGPEGSQKIMDIIVNENPPNIDERLPQIVASIKNLSSIPDDVQKKLGIDVTNVGDVDKWGPMADELTNLSTILNTMPEGVRSIGIDLMLDANGKPLSPEAYGKASRLVTKAYKDLASGNSQVKKKAIITLIQETKGATGKNLSLEESQQAYQDLIDTYGEAKILKLPPDSVTKVIDLRVDIKGLQEAIDSLDAMIALNPPEGKNELIRSKEKLMQLKDAASLSERTEVQAGLGLAQEGTKNGGGGSNPLLDLKKSILDQIKMYVDINATMKKLNDQKYKFADMILGKGGVLNKLQGLKGNAGGLSDSVIDVISGMGPDAAKKWIKKNTKDGKLTKEGQNQADLIFAAQARGTIEGNLTEFRGARAQRKAYRNLRGRGLDNSVVQSIAGDPEKAKILEGLQERVNAGIKGSVKDMNAFINSQIKATREAELLARAQDPLQTKIDDLTMAHRVDSVVINKQIKIYEDQITAINKEISAIQELNSKDQNRIRDLDRQKEIISRQIETLSRANELDQRRADALKREDEIRNRAADALSHELDIMSQQETKIRESYDKRIKALDEVAKINDYIIGQQKSQLGLAQALSQGDVYAAAAAQQDMQAGTAQFAQNQMRAGLQTGMENQVAGLTTAGGLTRDQAEAQINAIKEQSYQTSLLIRDIEDAIYNRNLQMIPLKDSQLVIDNQIRVIQDAMYVRETEIIKIQDEKLDKVQKQLDKELEIKKTLDDKFESSVADYELQKDIVNMIDAQSTAVATLSEQYAGVAEQINNINDLAANATSKVLKPNKKPNETEANFSERYKKYQDRISAIEAKRQSDAAAVISSMPSIKRASGGIIGDGGRDSVSAMLTPGEYVMRKASVQKYGMPMLSSMNMGAFEMPKYNTQQPDITVLQPTSNTSNINAPVYNTYSVNVSANTNASADDIANTVMTKIKRVDSMAVRSFRGY
jgi:hypothetical protein